MPDNSDSSAELNRIELIGVCRRVLREIAESQQRARDENAEKRNIRIKQIMQPHASWIGTIKSLTQEQAEKVYQKEMERNWSFNVTAYLHGNQKKLVSSLLSLALASDADTIRVTKGDFSQFSSYWRD